MIRHGTLTGYTTDGCRCQDCRDANSRWSKNRRLRQAEGNWQPFVPVTQALEVIAQLRARGLSVPSIAQTSGLPTGVVSRLVWDSPYRPERVRTKTFEALRRALRSQNIPDGAFVNPTGTRRRLEALAVQGWSHAEVARRLGCSTNHIAAMRKRPRVTQYNADRIRALYDELSLRIGPSRPEHRRRALRQGWAPPLAWDEGAIDDPAALPDTGAVEHRPGGGRPPADLDEVEYLLSCGVSPHQAAAQVGRTPVALERAAERAGRRDLAAAYRSHREWARAS